MIAPRMINRRMIDRRVFLATLAAATLPARAFAAPATLKAGEILRGRFTQDRYLKGFAAPIRSDGSFVLSAGQGLIWRVAKPFATTTVITPEGLVQVANGRELTRLSATRAPFLARLFDVLNAVMAGDWTQVETMFAVTRAPAGGAERLTLTPRRPEDAAASRIQSIAVTIDRFAQDVEIRRADDDYDRLAFVDQTVSAGPLSADEQTLFDSARS